jgi:hypothetical protein
MLEGQTVHLAARRYSGAASFVAAGRRRLKTSNALLVAATCRLRIERVTARHAFVVTSYETRSLLILDSLGPAPIASHLANASISSSELHCRFVSVAGARWDVDLAHPIVFIGGS